MDNEDRTREAETDIAASFHLDDEAWAELQSALSRPLEPKQRLSRLLSTPSVLERDEQ